MQVTGLALFDSGQLHSRVEGSSCKVILLSWFFKSLIAQENLWGLLGRWKEMRVDFGESYISKRDQKTLSIAPHPTLPSTSLGGQGRETSWKHWDNLLTDPNLFYAFIYLSLLGTPFWAYSSLSPSQD